MNVEFSKAHHIFCWLPLHSPLLWLDVEHDGGEHFVLFDLAWSCSMVLAVLNWVAERLAFFTFGCAVAELWIFKIRQQWGLEYSSLTRLHNSHFSSLFFHRKRLTNTLSVLYKVANLDVIVLRRLSSITVSLGFGIIQKLPKMLANIRIALGPEATYSLVYFWFRDCLYCRWRCFERSYWPKLRVSANTTLCLSTDLSDSSDDCVSNACSQ